MLTYHRWASFNVLADATSSKNFLYFPHDRSLCHPSRMPRCDRDEALEQVIKKIVRVSRVTATWRIEYNFVSEIVGEFVEELRVCDWNGLEPCVLPLNGLVLHQFELF